LDCVFIFCDIFATMLLVVLDNVPRYLCSFSLSNNETDEKY
jgi:hypothetical protein